MDLSKSADLTVAAFLATVDEALTRKAVVALFNAVWKQIEKRGYFPNLCYGNKPRIWVVKEEDNEQTESRTG